MEYEYEVVDAWDLYRDLLKSTPTKNIVATLKATAEGEDVTECEMMRAELESRK